MDINTVVCYLRQDGRIKLKSLSKMTHIAIDDLNAFIKQSTQSALLKPTVLLDFDRIGFSCKTLFQLNVAHHEQHDLVRTLKRSTVVNSLFKTVGKHDFVGEAVFPAKHHAEMFFSQLQREYNLRNLVYVYTTREICREALLTSPYISG